MRIQNTVYAQVWVIADFEMKVRRSIFDSTAQQIVDTECHFRKSLSPTRLL